MGLHQPKKLFHGKGNYQQNKRQPSEREKIFANNISDNKLISKIYKKNLILLNTKKKKKIKNWAEDLNRHFSTRRHVDGQQTYEEMLNITNIRENYRTSPHICQNVYYKKHNK